jgi:hypothetical protein
MNPDYIKGYCDGQGTRLTVTMIDDLLSAEVKVPDGFMWSHGHTAIALTQRVGQPESEFWFELLRGMHYSVVPDLDWP